MRAFVCQRCRGPIAFEALACPTCGAHIGFDPASGRLLALATEGRLLRAADGPEGADVPWRRCPRWRLAQCNWLVPAGGRERLCASCRLTKSAPDRPAAAYRAAFATAEVAKRRLLYQLGYLHLPVVSRAEDPEAGLTFDLRAGRPHVVTGHDNGVITIDLNETDDVFREQARAQFGEPYRTLLGHFRRAPPGPAWPPRPQRCSATTARATRRPAVPTTPGGPYATGSATM